MLKLNADDTFHFELLRVLGSACYHGADIGELLNIADQIQPGDFDSWFQQFEQLAQRVRACADVHDGDDYPASVRNDMFRAASYFRAADFFLHGNASDPRINSLWKSQTECFDRAISLLPVAGERITIQAADFRIPAIFYRAAQDGQSRPTLLMCNGYDGSQEEMLHHNGFAALERGFNVFTFEGPGQPTVRREQNLGFIAEWEKVVTPVLDHCQTLPEIDTARIGLLGNSFGGYLAPRAAAFEHRLAAVLCIDGLHDIFEAFTSFFPPELKSLLAAGAEDVFNRNVERGMSTNTKLRWAVEQGMWSFKAHSAFDLFTRTHGMSLREIIDRVACPVLVCDAENDRFFQGQPEQLAEALGSRATYHKFTAAEAAGEHCHVGASVRMNAVVLDWFQDAVGKSPR